MSAATAIVRARCSPTRHRSQPRGSCRASSTAGRPRPARPPEGTRVVHLRFGLVVGDSGFLPVLKTLGQLGLLTQLGEGTHHWPWVGIRDTVRAIELALEHDDVSGALALVGPTPVTADDFMSYLAAELKRPKVLKTPSSLIGFTLREAGRELFLADQNVTPQRLHDLDFQFREVTAQQAIDRALRSPDFAGQTR